MADQKLSLSIETKADVAALTTTTTATKTLADLMRTLEIESPEVAEALKKVEKATALLGEQAAQSSKHVESLDHGQKKSEASHNTSGRAIATTARALEDLQGGISTVVNNIPNLVQQLGAGAGLAGVLGIVSVGLVQLVKHFAEGADKSTEYARAAAEAAEKSASVARADAERATAAAKAQKASEELTAQLRAEDAAYQALTTSLKGNLTATLEQIEGKEALRSAELNLNLARIQADENLSPSQKLEQSNALKLAGEADGSAAQQERFAAQRDALQQQADAALKRADELADRASSAEQAKLAANALKMQQINGEDTAARGGSMISTVREEIANSSNTRYKSYSEGIPKEATPEDAARIMLGKIAADSKKMMDAMESGATAPGWYDDNIKVNNFAMQRLEMGLNNVQGGATAALGAAKAIPYMEAQSAALGDPDALRQQAQNARYAAAQASAEDRRLAQKAETHNQIADLNQQAATIRGGNEVEKAQAAEVKQASGEERARDNALSQARALASKLNSGSRGATGLNKAASSEDIDALVEVVNELYNSLQTTTAQLKNGVRKDIENLRNQVKNLRKGDRP